MYITPQARRDIPRLREAQLEARANGDTVNDAALGEAINGELDEILSTNSMLDRSSVE